GKTYDPSFIKQIGAQGIKPDVRQARIWYERAKALGNKDADAQLDELAKTEALAATPAAIAPKPVEATPMPVVDTQKPAHPQPPAPPAASTNEPPKPVVAPASPDATRTGAVAPDWVKISSPVNIRSGPTPQAEAIKIAEPGKRYQATARQGSWVQVTD